MAAYTAAYARAFADVVTAAGLGREDVERQLEDFRATLDGSRELRKILLNPSIAAAKRVEILDLLNGRMECGRQVRNFLAVLIRNERLGELDEILSAYGVEMNRRLGVAEAEVVTARRLDREERREMERHVARLARGEVRASFREDASLLGGAIVRIGSTVYDGSVRGRLKRLESELAAG